MKNTRISSRSNRGQGIVEGTVGLVMIVGAGVLVIAFMVNIHAQMLYATKAQAIAQLAAESIRKDKYWLDVTERDDYNEEKALDKARTLAGDLAIQYGMPPVSGFDVAPAPSGEGTIQRVRVTFSGLRIPFVAGGVFPTTTSVEGIGCTVQAPIEGYAAMNVGCIKPGDPNALEVALVPVLGFTTTHGNPAIGEGLQFKPGVDTGTSFSTAVQTANGGFSSGWPKSMKYFRGLPIVNPNLPFEQQPRYSPYVVTQNGSTATGNFIK